MGFGRWGGWEPSSRGWEAPGGPPEAPGGPPGASHPRKLGSQPPDLPNPVTYPVQPTLFNFSYFFDKNQKNPGWHFRQIEGLEPSGVLPLNAPRRVSMTQASISL